MSSFAEAAVSKKALLIAEADDLKSQRVKNSAHKHTHKVNPGGCAKSCAEGRRSRRRRKRRRRRRSRRRSQSLKATSSVGSNSRRRRFHSFSQLWPRQTEEQQATPERFIRDARPGEEEAEWRRREAVSALQQTTTTATITTPTGEATR